MLVWKRKTAQYENGKRGYMGRWPVVSVDWDGGSSRDDDKKYKLTTSLPGLKSTVSTYVLEADAMKDAEEIVGYWLSGFKDETKTDVDGVE